MCYGYDEGVPLPIAPGTRMAAGAKAPRVDQSGPLAPEYRNVVAHMIHPTMGNYEDYSDDTGGSHWQGAMGCM